MQNKSKVIEELEEKLKFGCESASFLLANLNILSESKLQGIKILISNLKDNSVAKEEVMRFIVDEYSFAGKPRLIKSKNKLSVYVGDNRFIGFSKKDKSIGVYSTYDMYAPYENSIVTVNQIGTVPFELLTMASMWNALYLSDFGFNSDVLQRVKRDNIIGELTGAFTGNKNRVYIGSKFNGNLPNTAALKYKLLNSLMHATHSLYIDNFAGKTMFFLKCDSINKIVFSCFVEEATEEEIDVYAMCIAFLFNSSSIGKFYD